MTFTGNPAYPLTTQFSQDKNNFGPRLGVAYDFGGTHDTVIRAGYGVFYGLTSNSAIANALTNNAISQASYTFTPTSPGAPAYPATFSAAPNVTGVKPNINVLAERPAAADDPDVRPDARSARRRRRDGLGVVSLQPRREPADLPGHQLQPGEFTGARTCSTGRPSGPIPLYRGTRPDPNVGSILLLDPAVTSKYNALVLAAKKRFSKGLLFDANYTLSKAVDNGQESTTFFSSFGETFDPLNLNVADGETTSTFDRRHRFVGSVYYRPEYPLGHRRQQCRDARERPAD